MAIRFHWQTDVARTSAIGANLDTSFTALLENRTVSRPNSQTGAEMALTQLRFKVPGTLLVYPWRSVRHAVLAVLRRFNASAMGKRPLAVAYLLVLVRGLPTVLATLL